MKRFSRDVPQRSGFSHVCTQHTVPTSSQEIGVKVDLPQLQTRGAVPGHPLQLPPPPAQHTLVQLCLPQGSGLPQTAVQRRGNSLQGVRADVRPQAHVACATLPQGGQAPPWQGAVLYGFNDWIHLR